jgi:hypothetical protein
MNTFSHEFSGVIVQQRPSDGYVNATALAKQYQMRTGQRRDVHNWLGNKRTRESIRHLSSVTAKPEPALYQVVQGGNDQKNQGTWIHPSLAIRFAIWLDDEFGYFVEQVLMRYMVAEHASRVNAIDDGVIDADFVDIEIDESTPSSSNQPEEPINTFWETQETEEPAFAAFEVNAKRFEVSIQQVQIYLCVKNASDWITPVQIVEETGVSPSCARLHCQRLSQIGIFEVLKLFLPYRYRCAPESNCRNPEYLAKLHKACKILGRQ